MGQVIDLTDHIFGRLTVLERSTNSPSGKARWLCRCICGTIKVIIGAELRNGKTVSCGCARTEAIINTGHNNRKHGHATDHATSPEWNSWKSMRERCHNPNATGYQNYGGRGITVCSQWDIFQNFYVDMGPRPKGTSLDRIDVNGNYEPANCRWATRKEQNKNRRTVASLQTQLDEHKMNMEKIKGLAEEILAWQKSMLGQLDVIEARLAEVGKAANLGEQAYWHNQPLGGNSV